MTKVMYKHVCSVSELSTSSTFINMRSNHGFGGASSYLFIDTSCLAFSSAAASFLFWRRFFFSCACVVDMTTAAPSRLPLFRKAKNAAASSVSCSVFPFNRRERGVAEGFVVKRGLSCPL